MYIYLKKVTLGFTKLNEGSRFNEGPLYYSGSIIIEKGGADYKMLQRAFFDFLAAKGLSKEKIIEVFESKIKASDEYGEKQEVVDADKCLFFWVKSKVKPVISKYIDGKLIKSNTLKDEDRPIYEDALTTYGGDLVNIRVKLEWFPKYGQFACWPSAVHIIKDSPHKDVMDPEWNDLLAEEKMQFKPSKKSIKKTKVKTASASQEVEPENIVRIKKIKKVKPKAVTEEVASTENFGWDDIE